MTAEIGVIGGSGFYQIEGLTGARTIEVPTPFGHPSSPLTIGTLAGHRVAFVARHGAGHRILPSELPSHANLHALKQLGVSRVIGVSAVGSLREGIAPQHAVVPDQVIDRTRGRQSTFFGDGLVAHIGFADPFCPELSSALARASEAGGVTTHRGGTMVVIEGPAFSTRAESQLYRSWGAAVIGMTVIPEAKLAREAELCYASLSLVTDYDVWHPTEADVSADVVVQNLRANVAHARAAVGRAVAAIGGRARGCACGEALASSVITPRELVPLETRRRLALLLERHWGTPS
ncbi:MAG: S-methyl-5'-thioadenosine phosphorylase [Chloroflexi bacterium]|nr:S-methyl-5'-thioadenosine phosphorylase [Chloroflexota bacterium]